MTLEPTMHASVHHAVHAPLTLRHAY